MSNAEAAAAPSATPAPPALSGKQIKLKSQDDQDLTVPVEVASMSLVIKQMLDLLGVDENEEEAVPVKVQSEILRHVIEWCEHHRTDPPIPENESEDDAYDRRFAEIPDWDKNFMNGHGYTHENKERVAELMLAANYLDIKGLLEMTCKTVANWLRGHTTEEMRDILGVTSDFTPEEEAQARYENEFLEERERW